MSAPVAWYLVLAALLFALGALRLRWRPRRSVELLLHASILALVAGSRLLDDLTGQRLALLALAIAAAVFTAFRTVRPAPTRSAGEGAADEGNP